MKKRFLILIILLSSVSIFAQEYYVEKEVSHIHQDARVDSLLVLHHKINEYNLAHDEHDGVDGYRIHLFFESGNNSKARTMSVKNDFLRRYRGVGAYVIYRTPFYRLRVGDFRTRLEAERFLQRVIRRYPSAYVVKTKIKFPKLDSSD